MLSSAAEGPGKEVGLSLSFSGDMMSSRNKTEALLS